MAVAEFVKKRIDQCDIFVEIRFCDFLPFDFAEEVQSLSHGVESCGRDVVNRAGDENAAVEV